MLAHFMQRPPALCTLGTGTCAATPADASQQGTAWRHTRPSPLRCAGLSLQAGTGTAAVLSTAAPRYAGAIRQQLYSHDMQALMWRRLDCRAAAARRRCGMRWRAAPGRCSCGSRTATAAPASARCGPPYLIELPGGFEPYEHASPFQSIHMSMRAPPADEAAKHACQRVIS